MTELRNEYQGEINGVPGRFYTVQTWHGNGNARAPFEIASQKWTSERRPVDPGEWAAGRYIQAEIRFDDGCKNGKKSFAITGEIRHPRARDVDACGCIHDEIARYFPELAPLIRWHLMDEIGPMHYAANAVYHASDRDHNGRRAGEACRWDYVVRFGGVPISHPVKQDFWEWLQTPEAGGPGYDLEVIDLSESKDSSATGKPFLYRGFTFGGFPGADSWHRCPFKTERAALEFLAALQQSDGVEFDRVAVDWSEGKARDLDAAREAAKWPDAPDSILMAEPGELRAALEARLPALVEEFRADVIAAGFLWNPEGGDA